MQRGEGGFAAGAVLRLSSGLGVCLPANCVPFGYVRVLLRRTSQAITLGFSDSSTKRKAPSHEGALRFGWEMEDGNGSNSAALPLLGSFASCELRTLRVRASSPSENIAIDLWSLSPHTPNQKPGGRIAAIYCQRGEGGLAVGVNWTFSNGLGVCVRKLLSLTWGFSDSSTKRKAPSHESALRFGWEMEDGNGSNSAALPLLGSLPSANSYR